MLCNGVKRESVKTVQTWLHGFSEMYRCTKFGIASFAFYRDNISLHETGMRELVMSA